MFVMKAILMPLCEYVSVCSECHLTGSSISLLWPPGEIEH